MNQLLYFVDPMCSWCWGFSPYVPRIVDEYDDRAPIRLVMGGLRPFNERALDDHKKAYIKSHWDHVHEASGQPFNDTFFEREGFVYDTEPACRAVVTGRHLDPDREGVLLTAVQAAFYRDDRDVTDGDVLGLVAEEAGFDADAFTTMLDSDEMKRATLDDFQLARSMGVSGYPTLLCKDEDGFGVLTIGWQPWERIQYAIDAWLGPVDSEDAT